MILMRKQLLGAVAGLIVTGMVASFAFTLTARAQTSGINVADFGAVADDGLDDSEAIRQAVRAAFEDSGGVVHFPPGTFHVKSQINLIPDAIGKDLTLRGSRGTVLEISVGTNAIAFYAGNLATFTVEDIVFVGKIVQPTDPAFWDARHVIFSNYVQQTNIIRCGFYGLAAGRPDGGGSSVVFIGNTDAKIIDSQFDGSVGLYPNGSVVEADGFRGLTVVRATFLDYANFDGRYYSKSPSFVGSWIKATNGLPFNGNGQRRIVVEDSRFDEAAASAISIDSVQWVMIRGVSVNVNATTPGLGIKLRRVGHARVEQSWFGYSTNSRPAIDVGETGALEVVSLEFSQSVYFLRQTSPTLVSTRFCPSCVMPLKTKPTCITCK